jgi:FMN phosphatase YigB (HAD superfamily)
MGATYSKALGMKDRHSPKRSGHRPTVDLLTVDIWDTVLRRQCHPDAVKLHLARFLLLTHRDQIDPSCRGVWALLRLRQEAERAIGEAAKEKGLDDEYHHQEVYGLWLDLMGMKAISHGFSNRLHLIDRLSSLEWAQEKWVSYVDSEIEDEIALIPAKEVAFLSDFYWSGDALRRLLDHHQVGHWFSSGHVSCDVGLNKRSGRLYPHIHAHYDVLPEKHVHVGDNPHADIHAAKAHGIQTQHYLPEKAHAKRLHLEETFSDRRGFIRGVSERLTGDVPPACRSPEAYRYGQRWSILFVGFVLEVMERGILDQVDALYFLTREGEFFLKIYQGLQEGNALGFEAKPAHLLEVSRLATFAASLDAFSIQEMMRLWSLYSVQSMAALLKSLGLDLETFSALIEKHGLDPQEPMTYPWLHDGVKAFFEDPEVAAVMGPLLSQKKALLLLYLKSRGFDEGAQRVGIVDIGWRGTIQDNLAKTLPTVDFEGYYLGLNGFLNEQPKNTRKSAFGPDAREPDFSGALLQQVALLEMLTNASSGSVVAYRMGDQGVEVVTLKDEGEHQVHEAFVVDFQRGVLATVPEWAHQIRVHALMAEEIKAPAMAMWQEMIQSPPPFLGEAYFKLHHNETFGVGGFVDKGRVITTREVWAALFHRPSRLRLVQSLNQIGWLEGLLARRDLGIIFILSLKLFLAVSGYKERLLR